MKPLAAIALRNRILAIDSTLTVALKNVRVGGNLFGCSGFVTHPSGAIVYVNTDHNHGRHYDDAYYRTAKSTRDFTGGVNHSSDYAGLPAAVVALVNFPSLYA